jgi:hypothetical protein
MDHARSIGSQPAAPPYKQRLRFEDLNCCLRSFADQLLFSANLSALPAYRALCQSQAGFRYIKTWSTS